MDATLACPLCKIGVQVEAFIGHLVECQQKFASEMATSKQQSAICPLCEVIFPPNRMMAHLEKCSAYISKRMTNIRTPNSGPSSTTTTKKHDIKTAVIKPQKTQQQDASTTKHTPSYTLKPVPTTTYRKNCAPVTTYPPGTEAKTTASITGTIPKTIQKPPTPAPRSTIGKMSTPQTKDKSQNSKYTQTTQIYDADRSQRHWINDVYHWFSQQNSETQGTFSNKLGSIHWNTLMGERKEAKEKERIQAEYEKKMKAREEKRKEEIAKEEQARCQWFFEAEQEEPDNIEEEQEDEQTE